MAVILPLGSVSVFSQRERHAGNQQSDRAQDGECLFELLRHVFTPLFVVLVKIVFEFFFPFPVT